MGLAGVRRARLTGRALFFWLTHWREMRQASSSSLTKDVLSADALKYAKELYLSGGLCSGCCGGFFQLHKDFADFYSDLEFL